MQENFTETIHPNTNMNCTINNTKRKPSRISDKDKLKTLNIQKKANKVKVNNT